MIAGFIVETALGFILATCCYVLRKTEDSHIKKWIQKPLERGYEAFIMSAVYLTMSILIASNYVLAKKDFDISSNGFGILQTQITFAITVVSVLPLLYPMIVAVKSQNTFSQVDPILKIKAEYNDSLKNKFRWVLQGLVMALFVYPFVSQSIHNWAPTDVGEGNGPDGVTIVNMVEWTAVTKTCFAEANPLTDTENTVISTFELIGSLWAIVFALSSFLLYMLGSHKGERIRKVIMDKVPVSTRKAVEKLERPSTTRDTLQICFLMAPLVFSIPLLWGILRLRDVQSALAQGTTNVYLDNEWTFGQVMALVIFTPVVFDMVYCTFELD